VAKAKNINPNTQRQVIQIIPADGWGAEFHYDHQGKSFSAITLPLLCWSLVTEKQTVRQRGPSQIVGIIAGEKGQIAFADLEEGFYKYERLT
jgi:hypothetical protein